MRPLAMRPCDPLMPSLTLLVCCVLLRAFLVLQFCESCVQVTAAPFKTATLLLSLTNLSFESWVWLAGGQLLSAASIHAGARFSLA